MGISIRSVEEKLKWQANLFRVGEDIRGTPQESVLRLILYNSNYELNSYGLGPDRVFTNETC